jgi:hypothetical protein
MARKTPAQHYVHHKAITVELSDGWNLVTNSKARTPQTTKFNSSPSAALECNEENISALTSEVDRCVKLWESSQCCLKLIAILERSRNSREQIDVAICLGLGCISRTDSYDLRKSSLWQLAVFLSMARYLSVQEDSATERTITLFAQEPRFAPLDIAVLKSYGVEVLEKMNARDLMTPKTFIFAPFLPWPVLLQDILLDRVLAICISLDVRVCLEQVEIMIKSGKEDVVEGKTVSVELMKTCFKVGEDFLDGKNDVEFPEFELHSNALRGLRIYTRRQEKESAEV